jgi:hypothetical protein
LGFSQGSSKAAEILLLISAQILLEMQTPLGSARTSSRVVTLTPLSKMSEDGVKAEWVQRGWVSAEPPAMLNPFRYSNNPPKANKPVNGI